MKKKPMQDSSVSRTYSLPLSLIERVQARAHKLGISMSALVQQALLKELGR